MLAEVRKVNVVAKRASPAISTPAPQPDLARHQHHGRQLS
jgi:hypothetical protein